MSGAKQLSELLNQSANTNIAGNYSDAVNEIVAENESLIQDGPDVRESIPPDEPVLARASTANPLPAGEGHQESVEQAKNEDDTASEEIVVTARRSLPKF